MKQVLLSVPRNGYITETRIVEIPRETAAYVLTSPAHRLFTRAVRHKKTVSLYRHVAICPKCGREVQPFEKGNVFHYSDTEIEQWALEQQSLLSDPLPDELESQTPLQTYDDLYCSRCGSSFHIASEYQQVLVEERKKKLVVSIPIDLCELLRIRWASAVRFSDFNLTERLTFNLRNGHTFLSLHEKESVYAVWDITNEDVGALSSDPIIQVLESYRPTLLTIVAGLQRHRVNQAPFMFQELNLSRLILMTRFIGYPRSFYDAVPLYDSDNRVMKSFSALSAHLHDAHHVPEMLKKSRLPQVKSTRKIIYSKPELMFYLPELEKMWGVLNEVNLFRRFLEIEEDLLFGTLARLHKQPPMIDFFRDYCSIFSRNRFLHMLHENDWRCYAAQYLTMNPYCQEEERIKWKRLGNLPECGLFDLGKDIGPAISIPVPLVKNEHLPEDDITDCEISGYNFHRLRSLREFRKAGRDLRNCLTEWDVCAHGTVFGVLRDRRFVAAIEVEEGTIIQARAAGNGSIHFIEPLHTALRAWQERFDLDGVYE